MQVWIVGSFFHFSGGWGKPQCADISPNPGRSDPMWVLQRDDRLRTRRGRAHPCRPWVGPSHTWHGLPCTSACVPCWGALSSTQPIY